MPASSVHKSPSSQLEKKPSRLVLVKWQPVLELCRELCLSCQQTFRFEILHMKTRISYHTKITIPLFIFCPIQGKS